MNLKALARLRKQKKISQAQMAEALTIEQCTYNRIENGIYELKAKDLPTIAKRLGVTIQELIVLLYCTHENAVTA